MATKTEKRSAEETLKRLKKMGIKVVAGLLVLLLVAGVSGNAASKRTEAKFEKTIEEYRDKVADLEDENNRLIRTYVNVSTEVDLSALNTKKAEIAELATMEYCYTNAGRFSDGKKLFGFDVPFLKKAFTAKWDGTIKAGIDMNQVAYSEDAENHILIVKLPQAKILSHEIHSDSVETLDETKNVFNPIRVVDVRMFDATSKAEMEKRAIDSGLLEKARANAENVISKMFYQTPSIYTIQFEDLT